MSSQTNDQENIQPISQKVQETGKALQKLTKLKPEKIEKAHNVGQLDHNIHKVLRLAQKTNFPSTINPNETTLQKDQFFQDGFAERKLILILDVYDIIKKVKKHLKVKKQLTTIGSGPHPSDITDRTYQIINHKRGEALEFKYQINPTLQKTQITLTNKTEIPKEIIMTQNFSQVKYNQQITRAQKQNDVNNQSAVLNQADITKDSYQQSKIYSLRRHYERENNETEEQRKARKMKKLQKKAQKEQKRQELSEDNQIREKSNKKTKHRKGLEQKIITPVIEDPNEEKDSQIYQSTNQFKGFEDQRQTLNMIDEEEIKEVQEQPIENVFAQTNSGHQQQQQSSQQLIDSNIIPMLAQCITQLSEKVAQFEKGIDEKLNSISENYHSIESRIQSLE
eukprot:403332034